MFTVDRTLRATASILPFPSRDHAWVAEPIHLSPPHLVGSEMEALKASLAAGWLAPAGPTPKDAAAALRHKVAEGSVGATSS